MPRLPWLMVWDDHEVDNDYAGLQGQSLQADFREQRAAAYRAYWEHMPFPKATAPERPRHAHLRPLRLGRAGLHPRASTTASTATCRRAPSPAAAAPTSCALRDCPELLDPQRTLLGAAQERWLADSWDPQRRWNLLAQQTLMARFSCAPTSTQATYWTDGWDGYAPARKRLLQTVVDRKVPGVVVLGGDVHAHYVADLKADFDDARRRRWWPPSSAAPRSPAAAPRRSA